MLTFLTVLACVIAALFVYAFSPADTGVHSKQQRNCDEVKPESGKTEKLVQVKSTIN